MSMDSDLEMLITRYDARITSRGRTWQKQLQIILNPKYKNNYLGIKKRFKRRFELKQLPIRKELNEKQKLWWKKEILKQAGKPRGFAHVGGKAIDIAVGKLTIEQKKALRKAIIEKGYHVFLEKITKKKAVYGVKISEANVFHVYVKD